MTARQFIHVLGRRWYVVLVGLLCTGLVMSWASGRQGVYTTQVNVVFLIPSPAGVNLVAESASSLVTFAAIVSTEVNAGKDVTRFSSPSATLYGSGVRDGYSVTLPNSGGQWEDYFPKPILSVEVVGASAAEVRQRLLAVLAEIDSVVTHSQAAAGTVPVSWIRTEVSPSTPVITFISGSPRRGAAAVGLLGLALTALGALAIDRLLGVLRRRSWTLHSRAIATG